MKQKLWKITLTCSTGNLETIFNNIQTHHKILDYRNNGIYFCYQQHSWLTIGNSDIKNELNLKHLQFESFDLKNIRFRNRGRLSSKWMTIDAPIFTLGPKTKKYEDSWTNLTMDGIEYIKSAFRVNDRLQRLKGNVEIVHKSGSHFSMIWRFGYCFGKSYSSSSLRKANPRTVLLSLSDD